MSGSRLGRREQLRADSCHIDSSEGIYAAVRARGLLARQNGPAVTPHIGEDGLLVWLSFGEHGHNELVNVSEPWGAGGDSEGSPIASGWRGQTWNTLLTLIRRHPFRCN